MSYYKMNFDNTTWVKSLIQKIALILAIAFDCAAIFNLLAVLARGTEMLPAFFGWIIASLALRIASCFIRYEYRYVFSGGAFTVTKAYSLYTKKVLTTDCSDIVDIAPYDNRSKAKKLLGNGCDIKVYVIKLADSKEYAVYLDDYLYALLQYERKIKNGIS